MKWTGSNGFWPFTDFQREPNCPNRFDVEPNYQTMVALGLKRCSTNIAFAEVLVQNLLSSVSQVLCIMSVYILRIYPNRQFISQLHCNIRFLVSKSAAVFRSKDPAVQTDSPSAFQSSSADRGLMVLPGLELVSARTEPYCLVQLHNRDLQCSSFTASYFGIGVAYLSLNVSRYSCRSPYVVCSNTSTNGSRDVWAASNVARLGWRNSDHCFSYKTKGCEALLVIMRPVLRTPEPREHLK